MTETIDRAWIQTFSGKRFHILNPQPDEIDIYDIAHALALQCRFTGHTKFHYSVAQHSFYASLIVPSRFALEALLHDASEAYICDMSRPLKHYTTAGEEYLKVEASIEAVIKRKFGLPAEMSPLVKEADNAMLYTEKAALMPPMEWDTRWAKDTTPASISIVKWTPEEAEQNFMFRYRELTFEPATR